MLAPHGERGQRSACCEKLSLLLAPADGLGRTPVNGFLNLTFICAGRVLDDGDIVIPHFEDVRTGVCAGTAASAEIRIYHGHLHTLIPPKQLVSDCHVPHREPLFVLWAASFFLPGWTENAWRGAEPGRPKRMPSRPVCPAGPLCQGDEDSTSSVMPGRPVYIYPKNGGVLRFALGRAAKECEGIVTLVPAGRARGGQETG